MMQIPETFLPTCLIDRPPTFAGNDACAQGLNRNLQECGRVPRVTVHEQIVSLPFAKSHGGDGTPQSHHCHVTGCASLTGTWGSSGNLGVHRRDNTGTRLGACDPSMATSRT